MSIFVQVIFSGEQVYTGHLRVAVARSDRNALHRWYGLGFGQLQRTSRVGSTKNRGMQYLLGFLFPQGQLIYLLGHHVPLGLFQPFGIPSRCFE
jgi:hypothetical protein